MKTAKWKTLSSLTPKGKTDYTESELIIPALKFLATRKAPASTSDLIKYLVKTLYPVGHDAKIMPNRKDSFFSQKVRNLKSHDSLKRLDLAKHSNGKWEITDMGRAFLERSTVLVESMLAQGFKPDQLSKRDQYDYSKVIIEEGGYVPVQSQERKRSDKLKKVAISTFKHVNEGRVFCTVCDFDFGSRYGKHGQGYIEVHHLDPIFEKDIEGERKALSDALSRVVLVCSNCHRMIHRRKGHMLGVDELKKLVLEHQCK